MPETRGVQPEQDLQWLDLADFSSGLYDYSSISGSIPNVPAPKAAGDVSITANCIALPSGGLGPLPGVTETYIFPANINTTGGPTFVTGLLIHDELGTGDTEAVIITCYDDGTTHSFQAISLILETLASNQIVLVTGPTATGFFGSPYPEMTRLAASGITPPFLPTIVFPSGPPEQPAGTSQVYMYPNPTSPSSYTAGTMISGSPGSQTSVAGQLFVHEDRVFILAATNYTWPGGTTFFTNENINFTDPPGSTTLGNQQDVLFFENPYGYGGAGSQSTGELFLIKHRSGGMILTGDIGTNPSTTILPGTTATGNFFGRGASTPIGWCYGSLDNGFWTWNGSNTSQKISQNLDDNFFLPPEFNTTFIGNNYGYYVQPFGDKIYTSNNMLLDTRTNSWWRYFPLSGNPIISGGANLFWVQPVNGNFIYSAQFSFFGNTSRTFLYRFDPATPTQEWVWQSLPIRLTTNRSVQLREVVIRASSNKGNTGATIQTQVLVNNTVVGSATTLASEIPSYPNMIRMPIGAAHAGGNVYTGEDLTIRITALGNGGAAPNLHSISLGWKQIAHQPTIGVSV
jgi:hypothetical protein